MPAGRPSKYSPAYCNEAIEYLAQGYSLTAFAGTIGVSRETIYNWQSEHPEFFDAIKIGVAKSSAWWEARLRKQSETYEGNVAATIFGLKNRSREDWADRQEVTGAGGKDLIPTPTDTELARMLAFKLLQASRETTE